jgi:hypothetical protein
MFDAVPPFTSLPFYEPPAFTRNGPEVDSDMGDHPITIIDQVLHNTATGVDNFLFHYIRDQSFWTVFTLRDNIGQFRHLANFTWSLRYDVKFNWRSGKAQKAVPLSKFPGPSAVSLGPPTDPVIVPLLGQLTAPQTAANVTVKQAVNQALIPPNGNRSDNPEWFLNVPPDFFQ